MCSDLETRLIEFVVRCVAASLSMLYTLFIYLLISTRFQHQSSCCLKKHLCIVVFTLKLQRTFFSQQQCPVTATPLISVPHSRHLQKSLIQVRGLSSSFVIVDWPKMLGRRSLRSRNTGTDETEVWIYERVPPRSNPMSQAKRCRKPKLCY